MPGSIVIPVQASSAVTTPTAGYCTLFFESAGLGTLRFKFSDGSLSGFVLQTILVSAGNGLSGGGDLSANRSFAVAADADASIAVGAGGVKVGVLATDAQHGARGGGTQHANVVSSGAAGFMTGADKSKLDGFPMSVVPATRNLVAGAGLTGGGDLSADRTFDVVANADGSIVVNANDVQVGVVSDAQHGARGGGTQHANAVAGGAAGFLIGADKLKLDNTPAATIAQRLNANATTSVVTATNTNLAFAMAANDVWEVCVEATAQCSSTGGSKYAVGAPAGATIEGWLESSTLTITTLSYQRITAINSLVGAAVHTVGTTPGPDFLWFTIVNGATPGNCTIQIASVTAAQVTTVFAGATLRATRATNV